METLWQDVKYGVRVLLKNPGFTAVAVLALALGIGANTAIFSVVNGVLLNPLPYAEPDRLVMIWEFNRPRDRKQNVVSPANFLDWQEQSQSFEQMAAFVDTRFNLTGVDTPEELAAQAVAVNLFPMLGVSPALGRAFTPEEGRPESERAVILSHGLWQRRYGGDPGVLGSRIMLSGNPYTVVGVMPPGFQLFIKKNSLTGKQAELYVPIRFSANARVRGGRFMMAMGRLKPGVSVAEAQAEMSAIAEGLERQHQDFNTGWGVNLMPLHDQFVGDIRTALWVLLGAVGFVLLIACANVANLLLARAAARQKEIAVRTALGAARGRVIRQLLTESILLAAIGGLLGLGLAVWGVNLLLKLVPKDLPTIGNAGIDLRVLGFTLLVSLVTGLAFGLAPALAASRADLNAALKEGGRSASGGATGSRARNLFVVAEVALALVLLIGAGLLIRSFARLQAVNPGFDARNMLTARLLLSGPKYREDHRRTAFFNQALERIRALPGVRAASAISFLPFAGIGAATRFTVVGRPEPAAGESPFTEVLVIDPDYFRTMNIPLLGGRNFTAREATEVSHVVVVNEAMVRTYFPDEDPLGKRVIINMSDTPIPSKIIGVVGDIRHHGLDEEPRAMAYWPHPELTYSSMTLAVRADADPMALAAAVRREVQALDQDQPIADVRTMESYISESVARARFSALLLGVFAGVALLLAAVGIYGVMSYAVTQRRHEIGVRMALGARPGDILRLVLRQGMTLTVAGVLIGLGGAYALTRLAASLLYQVSATDPATFAAIALLLVGVALLACYLPARRATRVDPNVALRYE